MEPDGDASGEFLGRVLDAMPTPVLVVDEDLRIGFCNRAAAALLSEPPAGAIRMRGGEALHCIHASRNPQGCGGGQACRNCVIRGAVATALGGNGVVRRRHQMELVREGRTVFIQLLVTAAAFGFDDRQRVLLSLEDITELAALRDLVPICANCKKIRDDADYWQNVDAYFNRHLGINFTHGICPDCMRKLYPAPSGTAGASGSSPPGPGAPGDRGEGR